MDTRKTARMLAQESIVLLKNESHLLPLSGENTVVFFGRTQMDLIYSGNGSGASHSQNCKNILAACEEKGIHAETELKQYYQEMAEKEPEKPEDTFDWTKVEEHVNSGLMYEVFGQYHAPKEEYAVPDDLVKKASQKTDMALLVIGRNSGGEECDRHLYEDYELTASEKVLTDQVCQNFRNVVLILNINGLIDLSWTEEKENIRSILFIGIPGEEGASALADILVGNVNPSGKLPVTIARTYEDYPAARHFSWDKEHSERILDYDSYGLNAEENGSIGFVKSPVTVYQEDIYAGYRYFDSFWKEPLYPFGYGLSYSEFQMEPVSVRKETSGVSLQISVKNIGNRAGKEVVQVYLTACGERIRRPYQELKGFEKTCLLGAQEEEILTISVPWKELACYDGETASYVIEKGTYLLRAGNSSRDTVPVLQIKVSENVVTAQCENRLGLKSCNRGKLEFLSTDWVWEEEETKWTISLEESDIIAGLDGAEDEQNLEQDLDMKKQDVRERAAEHQTVRRDVAELVESLSKEELSALCVGYGPGVPFAAFLGGNNPETICDAQGTPLTTNSHPTGFQGYVSPAIEGKGIDSVFYKDGPAGIGEVTWPTEMLIACSFDKKLWYMWGDAVGTECQKQQVDYWLAPAVNLHRNPLGGRNFEYFSEDPFLTGTCACETAKGVQENHSVKVCPKHFAINEQETYRRGNTKKNTDAVDSMIQERAARELYLKPFEMLVREVDISCLMTSFNKINGVFAGGNKDLCTHILREEWGYSGYVVTDWGDMDIVVDGADAVAAGNDVVMPGGPPVIRQILKGLEEGRVSVEELREAVRRLLSVNM